MAANNGTDGEDCLGQENSSMYDCPTRRVGVGVEASDTLSNVFLPLGSTSSFS